MPDGKQFAAEMELLGVPMHEQWPDDDSIYCACPESQALRDDGDDRETSV
jgi:hypothetical protein